MEVYKETKCSFKESDGRKDEYFYFRLLQSSEKEEENKRRKTDGGMKHKQKKAAGTKKSLQLSKASVSVERAEDGSSRRCW